MRRLWRYLPKYVGFIGLIAVVAWAIRGTELSIPKLITGVPNILDYLGRMIPPSGNILSSIWAPLGETIQIALMAIILSSIVALPLSFLAARNFMTNGMIYQIARTILGILRGIPALLYAVFLVSMVGLGPFAGLSALALSNIGSLGRYFSEAIENINPEITDAVKATGADKVKVIVHAVIPELSVLIVGYILYYFESNIRNATVLGLVGAGGIGLLLIINIHLFKYGEVATIMLVLIAVVVITDRLSFMVRTKLIRGEVIL